MKKFILLLIAFVVVNIGCKKNDDSNGSGGLNTYLPLTTGSSFTYSVSRNGVSSTPTYTVQASDTTAFSKSYKKVKSTTGETSYYSQVGNDYYTLFNIPSLSGLELPFLKDNLAVNASWNTSQNMGSVAVPGVPIPVSITINGEFKIISKSGSKTVKGKAYNDVIHTQTTLVANTLVGPLPLGTASFYFAKNIGIIESTVALSNTTAGINTNETYELNSYTIK